MSNTKTKQQQGSRRLVGNFVDFAQRYELKHKVGAAGQRAKLGIDGGGSIVTAHYQFDPSGDAYRFGAAERLVDDAEKAKVCQKVMTSRPMVGLTERVVGNRLVVLGGRDGLTRQSNVEIQRGYQDDVARISTHFRQMRSVLKRTDEK